MYISEVQYLGLSLDAQYLGSISPVCLELEKNLGSLVLFIKWSLKYYYYSPARAACWHPIFAPEVARYFLSKSCNYKPHGIRAHILNPTSLTGGGPAGCLEAPGCMHKYVR